MSPMAEDRIEQVVRQMVSQLKEILGDELRAAMNEALDSRGIGGGTSTPAPAPRAAKAAPKAVRAVAKAQPGKRVRRTAEDLERVGSAILEALKKTPGLTSEGIQEATGMSKPEIQKPLEDLRTAKRVKTKGQRRGMQYFAK